MLAHELRETLVKIEHVDAAFDGVRVLRDIDVEIRNIERPGCTQGQVVGFLGPSGAGKTTLLRILAGLEAPARGRVLVDPVRPGRASELVPVRAGMVGLVHQSYPLYEHRTVIGNLVGGARSAGDSSVAARGRAVALLERFGLAHRADAWPCELSGGQRQRVAILQQLLRGHTYILMDEPFSGLDPINKAKTCKLIAECAALDTHTTIVIVTHDIRAAVGISDTLWLLGRTDGQPGSRILETYNLVERELAWQPGIERTPRFVAFVCELEDRFSTL